MVLERVKQMSSHLTGQLLPPHPLDPLSSSEIKEAVEIVRKEYNDIFFNAITLWEPRKAEMMAWLASPDTAQRPHRVADVVAIGRGSKVYDGTVDLEDKKILSWEFTEGVQPLVSVLILSFSKTCLQCQLLSPRWTHARLSYGQLQPKPTVLSAESSSMPFFFFCRISALS